MTPAEYHTKKALKSLTGIETHGLDAPTTELLKTCGTHVLHTAMLKASCGDKDGKF